MDANETRRARGLFEEALSKTKSERNPFLRQQCGSDLKLLEEVLSLLAHHDACDDFLAEAPVARLLTSGASERDDSSGGTRSLSGHTLGAYEVLELLGRGGMSDVYVARQENPSRNVALKVLRGDDPTERELLRFSDESRVLALLQHPNIAQIYDAGAAQFDGHRVPYFVMELIDGVPLTDYAHDRQLGLRERLELLAQVCVAVHHAHQKGVIHRDLKPANILVDAKGEPKVLDFGVARLVNSESRVTMVTQVGQLVGTIAYMSPEQCRGDSRDLDTRSDVYSLGVIGYQLVTGKLPYDLSDRSIPESLRMVCEQAPAPLGEVNRLLRGDLEIIISAALEKDRERRYQSASGLAADIRRFLRDEPIAARQATTLYQIRKFARRHKALVTGAAAAVLAILAGAIVAGLGLNRALKAEARLSQELIRTREAEQRAEDELLVSRRESAKATAVSQFLSDALTAVAPAHEGRDARVIDVLQHASDELGRKFAEIPETEGALRTTIGAAYMRLGEYEPAKANLLRAIELAAETEGPQSEARAQPLSFLGLVYHRQGDIAKAEECHREALSIRRQFLDANRPGTARAMANLGALLNLKAEYDEANTLLREALSLLDGVELTDALRADVLNNLSLHCKQRGQFDEALRFCEAAVAEYKRQVDDDHPDLITAKANLASFLADLDRLEEAEILYREILGVRIRLLGEDHDSVAICHNNLGNVLHERGSLEEAQSEYEVALGILRKKFGDLHPRVALALNNLATVVQDRGDPAAAETHARQAVTIAEKVLPAGHWYTAVFRSRLGMILLDQQRYDEAERELTDAHKVLADSLGADHARTKSAAEAIEKLNADRTEADLTDFP